MCCFEEFMHYSSCILKCNSFYLILRWCYVLLDNFHSCSMIHLLLRMRYFKSINLVVGFILCHVSPKAFPKDFAIYGAHKWPKFFICPPGEISFSSPCWYQSNHLFPLVAEAHLIILRKRFHKPTTSLFFSLLVFPTNSVLTFLEGYFPSSFVAEVGIFFSILISRIYLLLFISSGGIVMLLSSLIFSVCEDRVFFVLIHLTGVSCFHSSSLILSSFVSFLNRSAVWNLSYPLCHSFISSGENVLLISSSILSSCQDHVQFLPFTVGVLPKLYHSYSFPILF